MQQQSVDVLREVDGTDTRMARRGVGGGSRLELAGIADQERLRPHFLRPGIGGSGGNDRRRDLATPGLLLIGEMAANRLTRAPLSVRSTVAGMAADITLKL